MQSVEVDLLPEPCVRQRALSTIVAVSASVPSRARSRPRSPTSSRRPPNCRPRSPETRSAECLQLMSRQGNPRRTHYDQAGRGVAIKISDPTRILTNVFTVSHHRHYHP